MSFFSSTCHLLKLSIILASQKRKKEVQRWKGMHRSQSQCPKEKTECSSWIWNDQTHLRKAKLTGLPSNWRRSKDQGPLIWLLGKTYRDMQPKAPGVQEEMDPLLLLPSWLLFLTRTMTLSKPYRAVTSRETHKTRSQCSLQPLANLLAPIIPSDVQPMCVLSNICPYLEPGNMALGCFRTFCSHLRTKYTQIWLF